MQSPRIGLVLVLLILACTTNTLPHVKSESKWQVGTQMPAVLSGNRTAVHWLDNQSPDGTYGGLPNVAAAAAYAIWLDDPASPKPALAYSWIGGQLDNATNWFWGENGEYDVPGAALYSIAATENFQVIQVPNVTANFLDYQQPNGGFLGYRQNGSNNPTTSSVDTAEALRGLASARLVNAETLLPAVNYLFSLQNKDGSFNLTSTVAYDPNYPQGPETVSITALVLLGLNDAHFPSADAHVTRALNYLNTRSDYSAVANDTGATYSASLTAIALNEYGRTNEAATAVGFIASHQDPDGGFRDTIRKSPMSNVLDTAWASIALHLVTPPIASSSFLVTVVSYGLVLGIIAIATTAGIILLTRRNRDQDQATRIWD